MVLGGLVHDTVALPDADVLIGRETFLEKHVACATAISEVVACTIQVSCVDFFLKCFFARVRYVCFVGFYSPV